MSSAGRDALVAMLSRLRNDLSGLNLAKPADAAAVLQSKYPLNGDYLVEIRRLCERGVDDGWLCTEESNGIRFSRLATPSKHFPYSIDAVQLSGTGPEHAHPKGEVNVGWALDGKPRFCDSQPGWVVFSPGSRHVPKVTGGSMFLLYFLPDGAIDWSKRSKPARAKATAKRSRPKAAAAPKRARTPARAKKQASARS